MKDRNVAIVGVLIVAHAAVDVVLLAIWDSGPAAVMLHRASMWRHRERLQPVQVMVVKALALRIQMPMQTANALRIQMPMQTANANSQ